MATGNDVATHPHLSCSPKTAPLSSWQPPSAPWHRCFRNRPEDGGRSGGVARSPSAPCRLACVFAEAWKWTGAELDLPFTPLTSTTHRGGGHNAKSLNAQSRVMVYDGPMHCSLDTDQIPLPKVLSVPQGSTWVGTWTPGTYAPSTISGLLAERERDKRM